MTDYLSVEDIAGMDQTLEDLGPGEVVPINALPEMAGGTTIVCSDPDSPMARAIFEHMANSGQPCRVEDMSHNVLAEHTVSSPGFTPSCQPGMNPA